MLKDINNNYINDLPKTRKSFFSKGFAKLTKEEYQSIEKYINKMIDKDYENSKDGSITVPGWNAHGSWGGTTLQIIWDKLFTGDETLCAFWYGLAYMQVLIDRDDEWIAIKTNFNRDFDQMVYFKPRD